MRELLIQIQIKAGTDFLLRLFRQIAEELKRRPDNDADDAVVEITKTVKKH